jgi:protein ImuB
MAIWLTGLALDRWRRVNRLAFGEGADAAPLALISDTAHGPRIDAVNAAGRAAGAGPGMRLTDARALCPDLAAVPSDSAGDLAYLEKLALWAQRWGPWSALDPPDGLLVDITGTAHLFGGEAGLLADLEAAFADQGLSTRAAIAPTAGAAWALAHFAPQVAAQGAILGAQDDPMRLLGGLPVAALRLDNDVLGVLRRLGLKRLGDLAGLGLAGLDDAHDPAAARDALHRRFRNRKSPAANPLIRLDQLLGRVPEPLLPVVAQPMPLVQRRLMEPIRHRTLLDQVLGDLAQDLERELEARGQGARRIAFGLWRVDGEVLIRRLELAAATRDPAHITRLFAGKLEGIDAGFGIEMVRLHASWCEPLSLSQADIEAAAEAHGTTLAACIDRLTARLGAQAVTRAVPHASHLPERGQRWQAPLAPEPTSQGALIFHERPLKLLDKSEGIAVLYAAPDGSPQRFRWRGEVRDVVRVEGPERIAPEWWRERSSARLRDYYRIEDAAGRRYWIYRCGMAGDGRGGAPDWFLQGLYA